MHVTCDGGRDSLGVNVLKQCEGDASESHHGQLVAGANQAAEQNREGGRAEHITVDLLPAVLVTKVTLLGEGLQ